MFLSFFVNRLRLRLAHFGQPSLVIKAKVRREANGLKRRLGCARPAKMRAFAQSRISRQRVPKGRPARPEKIRSLMK
jgi:hypothetical protein